MFIGQNMFQLNKLFHLLLLFLLTTDTYVCIFTYRIYSYFGQVHQPHLKALKKYMFSYNL